MKLRYLGTAAAEGFPAIFCDCPSCRRALTLGGRNIRTRSQAIVDDRLLIDFPCDTLSHLLMYGIDLTVVRHCLITHVHGDHFYPQELAFLRRGYSHPPKDWAGFHMYGSEDVAAGVAPYLEAANGQLTVEALAPFVPADVAGYTVTPLEALHGTPHPYIYLISDGEKTLLYAHDTDIFPERTWDYLRTTAPHIDLVSMDCTEGAEEDIGYHAHMCLGRNRTCRDMLRREGLIGADTPVVLNHFSHNGKNAVYEDFRIIAENEGFLTSYDGMSVEF